MISNQVGRIDDPDSIPEPIIDLIGERLNSSPMIGFDGGDGIPFTTALVAPGSGAFVISAKVSSDLSRDSQQVTVGGSGAPTLYILENGSLRIDISGLSEGTSVAANIQPNTECVIAYRRQGTTGKFFLNGVSVGTVTDSGNYSGTITMLGGASGGSSFRGQIGRFLYTFETLSDANILEISESDGVPSSGIINTSQFYLADASEQLIDRIDSLGPITNSVQTSPSQRSISIPLSRPLLLSNPVQPIFRKDGTLYAFGDSQTAGFNAAARPYTNGGFLLERYRWPNILATTQSRAMTVSNQAIGGSRISWLAGGISSDELSHFNMMGQSLPWNWGGTVVGMLGWNNISDTVFNQQFAQAMKRAYEAWIARALITDWFGITAAGWTRETATTNATPGWVCTGSTVDTSSGVNAFLTVFPYGNEFGPTANVHRYAVDLDPGESLTFTVSGKRAVALFFETGASSGAVGIKVNGVFVTPGSIDTSYDDTLHGDAFPMVVWVEGLPQNSAYNGGSLTHTITVYAYNAAIRWLAGGSVAASTSATGNQIVLGSSCGNTTNDRSSQILSYIASQAQQAAGTFGKYYPVHFSDNYSPWIQNIDFEPTDPSHLTDIGNFRIAGNFSFAGPAPSRGGSDTFIDYPTYISNLVSGSVIRSMMGDNAGSAAFEVNDRAGLVFLSGRRGDSSGAAGNDWHEQTYGARHFATGNQANSRATIETSASASQTTLSIFDGDDSAMKRVVMGADDSGGSGYKLLRVAN